MPDLPENSYIFGLATVVFNVPGFIEEPAVFATSPLQFRKREKML